MRQDGCAHVAPPPTNCRLATHSWPALHLTWKAHKPSLSLIFILMHEVGQRGARVLPSAG